MLTKILLLGSSGMLGSYISRNLEIDGVELIPASRESIDDFDFNKPDKVIAFIKSVKPAIIINAVACISLDFCEKNPALSRQVNSITPSVISEYCQNNKIYFIHISTDFVFDGLDGPYDENDQKNPINQYGKSKSLGEEYLLQNVEKLLILRTSWVYSNIGKNFFNSIKDSFMQNKKIYGATDIIGSPTRAFTIANFIASNYQKFLDYEFKRIYHICDSGFTTRYDFICSILHKIAEKLSLPCPEIIKVENNFFKLPAHRPLNSSLKNGNIVEDFGFIINDWEDELEKEIKRLKI